MIKIAAKTLPIFFLFIAFGSFGQQVTKIGKVGKGPVSFTTQGN